MARTLIIPENSVKRFLSKTLSGICAYILCVVRHFLYTGVILGIKFNSDTPHYGTRTRTRMASRKKTDRDPHAGREAEKYDNPIQSREFILEHLKERGAPATHETLCEELGEHSPEGIEALRRRLIAMCRDGQAICNRRGAYLPIDEADLVTGRVVGHRDGFGFLGRDEEVTDLVVSARQMSGVFHGDRVAARLASV